MLKRVILALPKMPGAELFLSQIHASSAWINYSVLSIGYPASSIQLSTD